MKKYLRNILIISGLLVQLLSCKTTTPAGFWTSFHKELLLTKQNDQGPWGGYREIKWKTVEPNTFIDTELILFAEKNNWTFIESLSISADTLTNSSPSTQKLDDYSLVLVRQKILPMPASNDARIFVFKTPWLAIEPGNARETFENGFAVINKEGTELKVFHFWGE